MGAEAANDMRFQALSQAEPGPFTLIRVPATRARSPLGSTPGGGAAELGPQLQPGSSAGSPGRIRCAMSVGVACPPTRLAEGLVVLVCICGRVAGLLPGRARNHQKS